MIHIVHRDDAKTSGDITYFEAPSMNALDPVNHAFCTRSVGLIQATDCPHNAGTGKAEGQAHVPFNRELVATTFGFESQQLLTMDQVHGDRIWIIDKPLSTPELPSNCSSDALLTDQRDIAIGVLTADCVPIVLVDPKRMAVGIIHAGWRGTLLGIAPKALQEMTRHFGTHPEELLVAIGPSIDECCYEVDEAVIAPFRSSGWNWRSFSKPKGKGKWLMNLARANIEQMRDLGMREEKCCWVRLCTRCNNDILFSYRAEGPGVGEQISFIQLRK
jgi:YfiH family protein